MGALGAGAADLASAIVSLTQQHLRAAIAAQLSDLVVKVQSLARLAMDARF